MAPLLAAALAAGCDLGDTARARARVEEERAELEPDTVAPAAFVAAVAPPGGAGACEAPLEMERELERAEGVRVLSLLYRGDGPHFRKVGVVLEADGTPRSYQDMRTGPGGTTTILLDLRGGEGTARNHTPDAFTLADGPAAAMLALPNLGSPRAMIDTVRARCGGPATN